MRRPEQTHVPEGGPSTSGYDHTHLLPEEEQSFSERFHDPQSSHSNAINLSAVLDESGVETHHFGHTISHTNNLYAKKNGRLQKLTNFISALSGPFTAGRIERGFVRPLYSETGQMVVIDNRDNKVYEINEEQAAGLGINKHYNANKNFPPRPPANRHRNKPETQF